MGYVFLIAPELQLFEQILLCNCVQFKQTNSAFAWYGTMNFQILDDHYAMILEV